jgi:hypothetical protein
MRQVAAAFKRKPAFAAEWQRPLAWAGLTLYVSRLAAELAASTSWTLAAGLGAGAVLVGALAWGRFGRRVAPMWPGLLAWLYVLSPVYDMRLAAIVAGLATLAWMALAWELPDRWPVDGAIFAAGLGLYLLTLSPGLLPADAGEFQLVVARLGVAHPPGYPLYTLLGKGFTLLWPTDPLRGLNAFSALTGALTLAVVSRCVRRACGDAWAGLAAALSLGVATSFWATATQASIRPLTALFAALCIDALLAYRAARLQDKPGTRALIGFGLAFGFGITHHPSLIWPGIAFLIYLTLLDPRLPLRPRRWLPALGAFALGFAPWVYLPLRAAAGATLAPPELATWPGFWDHVLARGFSGDLFYFRTLPALADRLAAFGNVLAFQWQLAIPLAALGAALVIARRDLRLLALVGGAFGLHVLVTMTYRAPQTVEYLAPAYVALAVGLGIGLGWLREVVPGAGGEVARALAISAVLVAALLTGARNAPSYLALAHDDSTRAYAESVLEYAPPEAIVLAEWHHATPMWALQQVEGMRPDVEVIYVAPRGPQEAPERWIGYIDEHIGARPLIVTGYFPSTYDASPYIFEPLGPAWLVRQSPRRDVPKGFAPLDAPFDGGLTLTGVDLPVTDVPAGETFDLTLAWQIDEPPGADLTGFVHLVYPDGSVIVGDDRRLPTGRAESGDVLIERYTLGAPPSLPPGEYRLLAGLYVAASDGTLTNFTSRGEVRVEIGGVSVGTARFPVPTAHPLNVRFENGLALRGFDWDMTLPTLRLALHWRALRSLDAPVQITLDGKVVGRLPPLEAGAMLTTLSDWPSGGRPTLGLNADGRGLARFGPWGLPIRAPTRLSASQPGDRWVPLGGSMALTHVEAHPPDHLPADGRLRLDLTFLAARPLSQDDVVKVDLIGEGYAWRDQSDHVPAGGALPTLKWVWGSRVVDRHRLQAPAGETLDAHAELLVYDHFTGRALPPLDPALAQLGPTVQLGAWEGE